jgi:hypothetical protein
MRNTPSSSDCLRIMKETVHEIMLDDKESGYRAKIILLKDEGYTVPEIRRAINYHMIAT